MAFHELFDETGDTGMIVGGDITQRALDLDGMVSRTDAHLVKVEDLSLMMAEEQLCLAAASRLATTHDIGDATPQQAA